MIIFDRQVTEKMNSLLHRKNDFGRKLATVTLRGPHIPLQEVSCNVASSIVTGSPLQEVSCNVASSIVTGSLPSLPNALLRNEDFHRPGSRIDVSDAAKHYLQKQDYRNRTARLQSFRYWDGLLLSAELVEDLVDAGFYMISQPDVVRCCSCRVEISNWRRGDKAIDVHRRYNPSCDFVKSYYIQKLWYADNDGLVCDDNDTASRDVVGAVNQLDSERPAIKERIKKRVNNLRPRIAAGGFRDLPRAYHPLASISIHSQTVKDFDTWSSPSSTCPAENISFVSCYNFTSIILGLTG